VKPSWIHPGKPGPFFFAARRACTWRALLQGAAGVSLCALLTACGGGSSGSHEETPAPAALSATAAMGEKIFNDTSLSASGRQSCAACHVSAAGHASENTLAGQPGGVTMDQQGVRQTPSIRYLTANTPFFFDKEGTPTGGFFWDGRAASLADQAREPFLNAREMANADVPSVVEKLSRASYAAEFRKLYGEDIFSRPDDAYTRMTLALAQYQKEDHEFHAFTSRYDAFLDGRLKLSDQEMRGLALFNSPAKGNCAACHPSARGSDGSHPLFTDFTYDNLGVPRNPELLVNADPTYFDLGLCARPAGDLANRADLCGAFKVPSLRNVTRRQSFFHNGRFKSLKDVLTFYVQRDTHPEKWYPLGDDGQPLKFNDLPSQYAANVNTSEAPYNRLPGDAPALSDSEIDDVIAFLRTLDDDDTAH
jgi:cytochrome c peroxidase